MAAVDYKVNDGAPNVFVGDSAVDLGGEEGGLHLHQLPQQDGVELGDLAHKVHGGHQGDVEGIETNYCQTSVEMHKCIYIFRIDKFI